MASERDESAARVVGSGRSAAERGAACLPVSAVEALDRELAEVCRSAGALRLRMGEGLEVLARSGGHHELGFPTVEAYALERCERSARWVQEARSLARRLWELPAVRNALMSGRLGWSKASVVASVAVPEDAARWLDLAMGCTVRQLRSLVREISGRDGPETRCEAEHEPRCTLTVTMDQSDAWLFECARQIVRRVGGDASDDAVVEALLAEGQSTLLELLPAACVASADSGDGWADMQRAWEQQRARMRDEAEALCESRHRLAERAGDGVQARAWAEPVFEGSSEVIDKMLREISAQLLERDLRVGRLAETLWRQDGFRRLGYATGAQYARERLGSHVSSIEAKRKLARRIQTLPELADAIERGVVGYEAARLVARIATPETVQAWVERASERTVVHLREEVDAMEMIGRVAAHDAPFPPSETLMDELGAVECEVISGRAFAASRRETGAAPSGTDREEASRGAEMSAGGNDEVGGAEMSAVAAELFAALSHGFWQTRHTSKGRTRGHVTLRLHVRPETRGFYRALERDFDRWPSAHGSFVGFLCRSLITTWNDALATREAYAAIYARDGYRCRSPVCRRRDVTPHHLRFRSAGGTDDPENVVALCVWCHLEGIHGGRLRAEPPASAIRWTIGRGGHTEVVGRRRVR